MITISLKKLFLIVSLAFVFVLLIAIVFNIRNSEIIMAIVSFYYFVFLAFFLREKKISVSDFFQLNDFKLKPFIQKLAIYLGKYLLILFVIGLFISFFLFLIKFFDHEKFSELLLKLEKSNSVNIFETVRYPILKIINLLFLVPVFEEIIYRRFLFFSLRKSQSFVKASIISSIIFTLFHVDNFIMVFFAGVFLAYVFEKEKNVILNILIHSFINMLFLMTFLI